MSARTHAPFFYVESPEANLDVLFIKGDDARHLGRVRRAQPGQAVSACDGKGTRFDGVIRSIGGEHIAVDITARRFVESPRPSVTVVQGLSKGWKPDFIVQKLVELGVDEIAILAAGHSVPRWESTKAQTALQRWQKVAHEASKQSHRAWLPKVTGPIASNSALELLASADASFIAEPAGARSLRAVLPSAGADGIVLMVGPEGGFSKAETDAFTRAGAVAVSLGEQIPRTETAGVVFAALVLFQMGRLG